jgi:chemotaxis protein MotB
LAVEAVGVLGSQIGSLPNAIVIEGHTDAAPYAGAKGYTNWELSTDRAHQARRLMQEHGVRPDQIKQIRGYADQSPRNTADPMDPSNRRISVIVLYGDPSTAPKIADGKGKKVKAEATDMGMGGSAPKE